MAMLRNKTVFVMVTDDQHVTQSKGHFQGLASQTSHWHLTLLIYRSFLEVLSHLSCLAEHPGAPAFLPPLPPPKT